MELAGVVILLMALGVSLFVQVDVWRAVYSNGYENEDDDFKIRTEERQREAMKQALEEKDAVIAKLKEARLVLLKEKADVRAMHDHARHDEDQASQGSSEPDAATFDNPLSE